MRALLFSAEMVALLSLVVARPFVGVLLWSWVSFMNPHKMTYGFAISMPWAVMIYCATLLGCLVNREPKRFTFTPTTALMLAFMALIAISSSVALAPAELVDAKLLDVEKMYMGLLLTMALVTTKRQIHALLWIMVISLGFWGVRGGVFAIVTAGAYRTLGPPGTMIFDNNNLAAGLLVALPLMNYVRLQSAHRIVRTGLLAAMGLTLLCVLASYSRGALVGLAAMSTVFWWRSSNKIGTALVLGVVLVGALSFMPDTWWERMQSIGNYSHDASAEGRLDIWHTAIKMALSRPLTGAGFMGPYVASVVDQFTPGTSPRATHSIYFEVMGENGLVAFAVWIGMTIVGAMQTMFVVRRSRHRPDLRWAFDFGRMAQVSIVTYLVAGAFLSLCYWDFYFTLLVVIAATRTLVARATDPATVPVGRRVGSLAPLALQR